MLRTLSLALVVIFLAIVTVGLGACAAPAPTPTPTKAPVAPVAPTATAAPAAATKAPAAATQAPKPAPTPTTVADRPLSPPVKVKVGIIGSAVDAGFIIPHDKGYYKEMGLDVELINFATAALMPPPLGTGQLDVGGGGVNAGLFNTVLRGIPLKMVADKAHAEPGNQGMGFLLRKDLADSGAVKTPADLKGRVLSLPARGSTQEHMAEIMLARGRLTLNDVELRMVDFADQIPAFANKAIDIGHNFEPNVTTARETGVAVMWINDHDLLPYRQSSVVLYSPQFAQKEPEAAKRFMVGYLRGVREYNDAFFKNKGTDEVVNILAKYSAQKDPAIIRKITAQAISPDGQLYAEALQRDIEYFVKVGTMKETLDIKQVIDYQYVDYAIQKLGKYQK